MLAYGDFTDTFRDVLRDQRFAPCELRNLCVVNYETVWLYIPTNAEKRFIAENSKLRL